MLTLSSYHPEYTEAHFSLAKEVDKHFSESNHEGMIQVYKETVLSCTHLTLIHVLNTRLECTSWHSRLKRPLTQQPMEN